MDQLEVVAAKTVSAHTGLTLKCLDLGGRQIADFEFLRPGGGREGLLEVTSSVNVDLFRLLSDSHKRFVGDPEGFQPDISGSRKSWQVTPTSAAFSIKKNRPALRELLAEFEQLAGGMDQFHVIADGAYAAGSDDERMAANLRAIGVQFVWMHPAVKPEYEGKILVNPPSWPIEHSLHSIANEIQVVIDKSDNRAKLRKAGGGRADLFIWLDSSPADRAMLEVAVFSDGTDVETMPVPTFPQEIETIWIASTQPREKDDPAPIALWSVNARDGHWKAHDYRHVQSIKILGGEPRDEH